MKSINHYAVKVSEVCLREDPQKIPCKKKLNLKFIGRKCVSDEQDCSKKK